MKDISKKILAYGYSEGLARLAPFLFSFLAAKMLGAADFGRLSLIVVLYEIVFIIASNNIQAVTRVIFFQSTMDVLYGYFITYIKYGLIFIIFLPLASSFIGYSSLLLITFGLSALLRSTSVFFLAIFQCKKQQKNYAKINAAYYVTFLLVGTAGLVIGEKLWAWIFAVFSASLVQALIGGYIHAKTISNLKKRKILKSLFDISMFNWRNLRFGWLLMPSALGWWLKSAGERKIIEYFYGYEILGTFSLTMQFVSILIVMVGVVNLVLVPHINELLVNRNHYALKIILLRAHFIIAIFAIILYFFTVFLLRYLNIHDGYGDMTGILLIALSGGVLQGFTLLMVNIIYFYRKEGFVASWILIIFSMSTIIGFECMQKFTISIDVLLTIFNASFLLLYLIMGCKIIRLISHERLCFSNKLT